MGFISFKTKVAVRVAILAFTLFLLSYSLVTEYYLRSIYVAVFALIEVVELTSFVTRFTKDINIFFATILQHDFSLSFKDAKDQDFAQLSGSMNKLIEVFRRINSEKALQHQYLETLIAQISIGIISFDDRQQIHLVNKHFLSLVGKIHLTSMHNIEPDLAETMRQMQPGDPVVYKLKKDKQLVSISMIASVFKINETEYKLISLHDITNTLSATEFEAWHKLIRVLTHEIMNSITPIISLSHTLHDVSERNANMDSSAGDWQIMHTGVSAIINRTKGLQSFTKKYRELSQLPLPDFVSIDIKNIVGDVAVLFKEEMAARRITFICEVDSRNVMADPQLFQQALVNLAVNAMDALADVNDARIEIRGTYLQGKYHLVIADNGPGIPHEYLDKIFVPFFSTKQGGSGIGLALARQIVLLHKADLHVANVSPHGAMFTIMM